MIQNSIENKTVLAIGQAVSIKFNNLVYELKKQGQDVIVLSLGEAFFDIPLKDFHKLPFPDIYHYSHSRGLPELREKISEYFASEYLVQFEPDSQIIVTSGSKIAIYMALKTILNPGDKVLLYEPAWLSYSEQIKLCDAIPEGIPCDESVYDFEKYIDQDTKCLIINNPNNPRGKSFSYEELNHMFGLAEKYNLYILSDEAYSDFVLDKGSFYSVAQFDPLFRRTIICNSISKNFGISGWRVGYAITNSNLTNQILKLQQHLVTCPATIAQYYLARYFDELIGITRPQVKDIVEKRIRIAEYINEIGLDVIQGDATFYLFLSIKPSKLGSEEFCTRLLYEYKVSAVPGIAYGESCDRYIRISVGTESVERIKAGLKSIQQLIRDTE